jgi:class 3 adenylate cyclase
MADATNHKAQHLFLAFAAYLPSSLTKTIVSKAPDFKTGLKERSRRGTLLFADITGFTALCNKLEQSSLGGLEEMTYLLNRYFREFLHVAQQYGGVALKFGGDSILLAFNGPGHAGRAVACAVEMQAMMESYRLLHTSQGSFELSMSIGIEYGPLHLAVLGEEYVRLDYLLTGPTLQQVLLTEARAAKDEILITARLYRLLQNQPDFKFKPVYRENELYYQLDHSFFLLEHPYNPDFYPAYYKTPLAADYLKYFVPSLVRQRLETLVSEGQRPAIESEHRLVSCFFLVFPYQASTASDPKQSIKERLARLNHLFKLVHGWVRQYNGTLVRVDATTRGERFLVLFGAPIKNEDDSVQAALCALEIMRTINGPVAYLPAQIGLATGRVFCAEVGSRWRKEYTIMGSSINRAARLADLAQPGQILTDKVTLTAAKDQVLATSLGSGLKLKGFKQTQAVFQVTGVAASQPAAQVLLVGREAELEQLRHLVEQVGENRGRLVAITGPAGYGKSVLAQETGKLWAKTFRQSSRPPRTIQTEAAHYYSLSPYKPWLDILTGLVSTPEVSNLALPELVAHFAPWLAPDSWTLQYLLEEGQTELTFQDKGFAFKQSFFRLVWEILKIAAEQHHLLIIMDNLQWCDSASLELLKYIKGQMQNLPVLLMLVGRTLKLTTEAALTPPTAGYSNYQWLDYLGLESAESLSRLELNLLNEEQVINLVSQSLGASYVPPDLIHFLMERSQGHPFYLSEIIRVLRYQEQLTLDPQTGRLRWRAEIIASAGSSVESLIISQLDGLSKAEQEVLRVAAVIGPDFEQNLLLSLLVWPLDKAGLLECLNKLVQDGWLLNGEHHEGSFRFKQPVVQQIIYESLAFSRRRTLHRKIAQWLEERTGTDEQLELLAYHYGQSDLGQPAFDYACRAGHKAFVSYTYDAALTYYELALDWQQRVSLDCDAEELLLLYQQAGQAARLLGKADKAGVYFEKLLRLATQHNHQTSHLKALNGLVVVRRIGGQFEEAIGLAGQALRLAKDCRRPELLAETYDSLGGIYFIQGNFAQARENFEQCGQIICNWLAQLPSTGAAEARQESAARQLLAQSIGNSGLVWACTGQFGLALQNFKQAFEIVSQLNLKYFMLTLSINLGELYQVLFISQSARQYHQQALALAREIRVRDLECEALRSLGVDYGLDNQFEQAETYLLEALDLAELSGATGLRSQISANLMEVTLKAGKLKWTADLLWQLQEVFPALNDDLKMKVQQLQARLLEMRGQAALAEKILLHLVKQVEDQPGQQNLSWQINYQLAKLYRQKADYPQYNQALEKAFIFNQAVLDTLNEPELRQAFLNVPEVIELRRLYYTHQTGEYEVSYLSTN